MLVRVQKVRSGRQQGLCDVLLFPRSVKVVEGALRKAYPAVAVSCKFNPIPIKKKYSRDQKTVSKRNHLSFFIFFCSDMIVGCNERQHCLVCRVQEDRNWKD